MGVVMKFVQPINDLRIVIQKLNDAIDTLTRDNQEQNNRINKHGEQIDDLNTRVASIESNMNKSSIHRGQTSTLRFLQNSIWRNQNEQDN